MNYELILTVLKNNVECGNKGDFRVEVYASGVTVLLFAPNSGHVDSIGVFVCAPPEAQRMFDALKELLRSIQRNVYNL